MFPRISHSFSSDFLTIFSMAFWNSWKHGWKYFCDFLPQNIFRENPQESYWKIAGNPWGNQKQIVGNFEGKLWEDPQEIHGKNMRKLWEICGKIIRNSRESYWKHMGKIVGSPRKICEKSVQKTMGKMKKNWIGNIKFIVKAVYLWKL